MRLKTIIVLMLLSVGATQAQSLSPLSGGMRTEQDKKKHVQVIIEQSAYRVTLSIAKANRCPIRGIMCVQMRVDNLSDAPLLIETDKFSAVDVDGRGYSGLLPEVAAQQAIRSSAVGTQILGAALMGPIGMLGMGPAMEKRTYSAMNELGFQSGAIPAHSFRDGLVFFESAKIKSKSEVRVNLTGLWPTPIICTIR